MLIENHEPCTLKEFLECLLIIYHTLHPPDLESREVELPNRKES